MILILIIYISKLFYFIKIALIILDTITDIILSYNYLNKVLSNNYIIIILSFILSNKYNLF